MVRAFLTKVLRSNPVTQTCNMAAEMENEQDVSAAAEIRGRSVGR